MDLLDSLRAARQTYANVRMVLTGSIGLPEVERRLRSAGHRNRALNDVAAEIVPLFDEANARLVIAALARGAKLDRLALEPGLSLAQLLEVFTDSSRTQLSELLRHLIDDFYLVRESGLHRFALDFLREFWIEERGL